MLILDPEEGIYYMTQIGMRGGNPRRKGERGKFEGELFSILHSCRSNLEGEAGPSEVLPWKLFCSPTGESCDVT